MPNKIGFFTPVTYSTDCPKTLGRRLIEGIDDYFYLKGKKATVIDPKAVDGKILIDVSSGKETTVRIALKVASYIYFAVPMLIAKLIIRATHKFAVVEPRELLQQVDRIVESNNPAEKKQQLERKKQLLGTAYSIAIFRMERNPSREISATIGEILMRFAILNYQDYTLVDRFEIAKQLLFGALNAQLYAAGVLESSFDFSAAAVKKLRDLPATILEGRPFKSMEASFYGFDTDILFNQLCTAKLSDQQRIVLCRTLRYINGADRHLLWKEERKPEPENVERFKKLLYLAEKCIQIDAPPADEAKSPEVLREFWELRYNDFPYFYDKALKEEAKVKANWDWLYETCRLMPETYLRDVCRIANKSAQAIDNYQNAWRLSKTALWHHLDAETGANLENIMERHVFDAGKISAVAEALMKLDPKRCELQIAWFAMLPSNMASTMMRDHPNDLEKAKGLLYLAKELVDKYEKHGVELYHFKSVKYNYYLFHLLKCAEEMRKTLTKELEKVESIEKITPFTAIEVNHLSVALTHLKMGLRETFKPMKQLVALEDGKKYAEFEDTFKKIMADAVKKLELLKRISAEIKQNPAVQQEFADELKRIKDILTAGQKLAQELFSKAAPKQEPQT